MTTTRSRWLVSAALLVAFGAGVWTQLSTPTLRAPGARRAPPAGEPRPAAPPRDAVAEALAEAERLAREKSFDAALTAYARAASLDPTAAAPLEGAARVQLAAGRIEEAERSLEEALARLAAEDGRAAVLSQLAALRARSGRHAEAEALQLEALELLEQLHGSEDPRVSSALVSLALLQQRAGSPERAISALERALSIDERAFGLRHSNVAARLATLGLMLRDAGQPDAARAALERALTIDPSPASLTRLANLEVDLGGYAEAERHFAEALARYEQAHGERHPAVALALVDLAAVRFRQGDTSRGSEELARAFAIESQLAESENSQVAARMSALARSLHLRGDAEGAAEVYRTALEIVTREGENGAAAAQLREDYVSYLRATGRAAEADEFTADARDVHSG